MRTTQLSRVTAALMVVTVWLVSLVCEPKAAQGASVTILGPSVDQYCVSRLDEESWVFERQLERLDRSRRDREREEQRQDEAQLLEHSQLVHREIALRNAVKTRIADLVPEKYQDLVLFMAEQYQIDPRLLAAVGRVESRWQPDVLGTHDDTGLMQILPSTAEWIASVMGIEEYDLWDPVTNMSMGSWYLHVLHKEYGNWSQALAAYNGGPLQAHLGAEHQYTKLVMSVYHRQGG